MIRIIVSLLFVFMLATPSLVDSLLIRPALSSNKKPQTWAPFSLYYNDPNYEIFQWWIGYVNQRFGLEEVTIPALEILNSFDNGITKPCHLKVIAEVKPEISLFFCPINIPNVTEKYSFNLRIDAAGSFATWTLLRDSIPFLSVNWNVQKGEIFGETDKKRRIFVQ